MANVTELERTESGTFSHMPTFMTETAITVLRSSAMAAGALTLMVIERFPLPQDDIEGSCPLESVIGSEIELKLEDIAA